MVPRLLPWIGNGAYLALASAFLMTDILALRVLLVSGYSGLVMFHTLHVKPLRIPLAWSGFFVLINAGMVALILADRLPAGLSQEEELLHQEHFAQLTHGQFRKLLRLGECQTLAAGTQLTTEREVCGSLYYIYSGTTHLYLNDVHTAVIGGGGFVNDVAFHSVDGSTGAYGTIRCASRVKVISWSQEELRALLQQDPALARCLHHVLVGSLVRRLLDQRDQRDMPELSGTRLPRLKSRPTEVGDAVADLRSSLRGHLRSPQDFP